MKLTALHARAHRGWITLAGLVGALLLATPFAHAAPEAPGRVGRIVQTDGTVWIWDAEGGEWAAAVPNRPLLAGDRLAVDDDGRAELRIGPTVLRLDGGTELEFGALDDDRLEFDLQRGSLALRVPTAEHARETSVLTEEGRFEPIAAGHYRFDRITPDTGGGPMTRAAAWRGALQFGGTGNVRRIDAGEAIEVWLDDRNGVARTRGVALGRDTFGEWALAGDRAGTAQAYRYVSPEMTGAESLDEYGRWDAHPEYGSVWIPTAVPIGWAPFRDGHWAWMQPWGWTWVDAAPWGFAPSHYGRWVRWGARWAWWPGPRIAQPVFAPALVAWVGGPSVGLTMTLGGPPLGSWSLLGPYDSYRPILLPRPARHPHPGYWPGRRDRDHARRDGPRWTDGRDGRRDGRWRDGRRDDGGWQAGRDGRDGRGDGDRDWRDRDRDGRGGRDGRDGGSRLRPPIGSATPPGTTGGPTDERGVPIFVPRILPMPSDGGREPRDRRDGREGRDRRPDRDGDRSDGARGDRGPRPSAGRPDARVTAPAAVPTARPDPRAVAGASGAPTDERGVPVFVPRVLPMPSPAPAAAPTRIAPRAMPERAADTRARGAPAGVGGPAWRPGGDNERGER